MLRAERRHSCTPASAAGSSRPTRPCTDQLDDLSLVLRRGDMVMASDSHLESQAFILGSARLGQVQKRY
jgi:hypothetical protein